MEKEKRKWQIGNINSELPSSIMEVIFSKLPFFNLPNCRIVCRHWNNLISAAKFASRISTPNLFLNSSCPNLLCVDFDLNPSTMMRTVASLNFPPEFSYDYKDLSILNSCNGLLCLLRVKFTMKGNVIGCAIFVLNPMTNEYRKHRIPKADRRKGYFYGLGFGLKTKQYKLVRSSDGRCGTLIEILSFGTSREWTIVGYLPHYLCLFPVQYYNGGLYFISMGKDVFIYRLDVEDEKITEISPPRDFGEFYNIVGLNDTIYLTTYGNDHLFHVWKIREDSSLIRVFVAGSKDQPIGRDRFQLIKVCEDGKVLCFADELDELDELHFMLYDPKSETRVILNSQDSQLQRGMVRAVTSRLLEGVVQIGTFNFNSLSKILAGNA